jgi:hypothetical protein
MIRRFLAAAVLVAGASSCTQILGRFDDSGTGGAPTTTATGITVTISSGTVTSSSSSGGACTSPADCPPPGTACVTVACADATCTTTNAMLGTLCSDDGGVVCDGEGTCVGCNFTSDCTGSDICAMSKCVSATCADGMKDGNETDVDCGGSCPGCADGKDCDVASDCSSSFCSNGTCAACAMDGDCASGDHCTNGVCTVQQGDGQPCTGADGCASGFCADGFCCDSACTGTCQACSKALNGAGSDGQCGDIQEGTDPKNQCTDQGMASCGHDGECDGNGACQLYAAGTLCSAAGCNNGQLSGASTCDGTGTCQPGEMTSCSPYASCNGAVCASACQEDSDCVLGDFCDPSGKCAPPQPNGAPCTANDQCENNHCTQDKCQ